MSAVNSTDKDDQAQSNFVRAFVQSPNSHFISSSVSTRQVPKKIVQFWDNFDRLPEDVKKCIETWDKTAEQGFERMLFDKHQARDFIDRTLGSTHVHAFDRCYHPAMQSDYFRLCYVFIEGGCYVDVDDVYEGSNIQYLFNDGRLKIQPLCYDTSTNMMVPTSLFTKAGASSESWIFYFNNNPLIAASRHPIIERALSQATLSLQKDLNNGFPEIQATTGPGNLTKSVFNSATEIGNLEDLLLVVSEWDNLARNKWELSYRNDARNWRLSNGLYYQEE